ncbi:hypothetical protein TNCV_1211091 [Trichonephila clavipes]|nr:hypothetical protein TNCV_1211091 [Trichonephila clavipes]
MIVNKSRFLFLHFLHNSFMQPVDDRGSVRTSRLLRNSDSAVHAPPQRQAVVDADGRGHLAKYLRRLVEAAGSAHLACSQAYLTAKKRGLVEEFLPPTEACLSLCTYSDPQL